jgi:ATP-dependent Clp protease ATP-binding subunit ClpX
MEGSKLVVTDPALDKIAELAIERKTGARSLRSIMEETLGTTMFDLPEHPEDKEVIIDTDDNNELVIRRKSYNNLRED